MTSELELQPDLAAAPTTMPLGVLPSASDLEQYWQLASRLCRTEFVPGNLRGKPEAVLAVFLTGRELGIGPMQSLRDVYPVNGRPGMMATLMVQRVRERGHHFKTIRSTPTEATVQIHRRGERDPQPPITFTLEDAKRARLTGKDTYQQYPTAMLWSRAASAACRRDASEALGAAVYTPEELDDLGPSTTTVQAGPAEIDGEPFEDGVPKRWAIENIRDPEDARWLLKQPEISDDYREAVKAVVERVRSWSHFWRTATADQWRNSLSQALAQQSDPGSSRPTGAVGDTAPGSPGSDQTSGAGERRLPAKRDVRHDPAPDPTTESPSTLEPEASPTEADRSRVEGANHKDTSQPGDGGTPPPSVATAPPGGAASEVPPPSQPPGGPQRSRPVSSKGKAAAGRAPTGQAGQAAFDHPQTSDPGRFAR